jgi:hypothetical protein
MRATSRPHGVPAGLSSISSAPEHGVSYRFAMWADLTPLNNLADGRVFQTYGTSVATQDLLGASFELPPGARVHDVEAYYSATNETFLGVAVWSSGIGNVATTLAQPQITGGNAGMRATKVAIPHNTNGPFPHGTMLAVFMPTLANQSIQVNGFRVGFTNAPLSTVVLGRPVRVFDSRKTGSLSAGQTRTISLSAHLPVGANGAQYVVSALNTHGAGELFAGPAGVAPTLPAVQWGSTGDRASNSVTTTVDAGRRIALRSATGSGRVDATIDLVGYLV